MMAGTQAIDLGGHCTLKGWQVDYTRLREATIDVTKQLSKNSGHTRILGKNKVAKSSPSAQLCMLRVM